MLVCFMLTIYYMRESLKAATTGRVKTWFVQLSFWKKIIIIFTLNTLVLLILTDAIMLVLFGRIADDIVTISNNEKQQFNTVSNTQIAAATAKKVLSNVELFSNSLTQLSNSYYFFINNPDMLASLESVTNPASTSTFTTATFQEPGYFQLNSGTTFTALPFIDELMGKMIKSQYQMNFIKRITVYVQNGEGSDDLSARTVPAINTFTIADHQTIDKRFQNLDPGLLKISQPYLDELTTADKQWLVGLRTIIKTNTAQRIMMEVELKQGVIQRSLENIYYFPSTVLMLVQRTTSGYSFLSSSPTSQLISKLPIYYGIGTSRFDVNGVTYVSASIGLPNECILGKSCVVTNLASDPLRCIVLVRADETEAPSIEIQTFLSNQSSILNGIVFSWSFIILLSTVALATVVGNYIFSNLKMLSTKMEEYIKDPSKFHLIVIELKELELKGILKKLSDNLIGIIEKIEVRKRERKDRINQNYHPLSIGEPKFQQRQQLNDYQIIEELKQEVRIKVEALQKEADEKAEKEKAEKEKAEKEK